MTARRTLAMPTAPPPVRDEQWWDSAQCRGDEFPDRWHPISAADWQRDLPELRAFCAGCAVAAECLADALRSKPSEDVGIRAGTTPSQRDRMRRADKESARPSRNTNPRKETRP